ncbi:hypothetical protein LS70_003260 [Helicobacter sp. MIT 11-5569]|uniref:methyltransferase regulatory domain-containing protein n=1 Tax=Helicobacter sp. MIT 11-5569 TaxID=1548151 RepID=UPI00051F8D78|nr:methyltransferase regulatory domain-containing protein [Helicobacter sp. MIT 11-5569]TLD84578.1 hypothetical protein LS70_003260 [Helicobacter sp. MIT 11-5569]
MQDDGYATELEYVDDFNSALNPLWIDFCLDIAGIKTYKRSEDSNFCYLELGFGMGNSFALHASGSEGEFIGNDFISAHCEHALKFLNASKPNAKAYQESFKQIKEKALRENLKFDYIVLHGVWSWISQENQTIILEIIAHCLHQNGVLFISYNCFPGWEGKYSMRHLLKLLESHANGNQKERIQTSLAYAQKFFASDSLYAKENPRTQEVRKELQTREINYLCHEFFNKDWHCLFFSQMADLMRSVQCEFACSAKLMWHFDPLTFNTQQNELLASTKDSILQEQFKDFFLNESFRMDIFVKNNKESAQEECNQRLLRTSFVLLKPPFGFQSAAESPQEFQAFCQKILEFFAKDSYQPKSLQSLVESFGVGMEVLLPILCAMITQGFLHPTKPTTPKTLAQTKAHNAILFSQPKQKGTRRFLASALIGGGFYLDEAIWTCLKAYTQGILDKDSLLEFVKAEIPTLSNAALENYIGQFLQTKALYQRLGVLD